MIRTNEPINDLRSFRSRLRKRSRTVAVNGDVLAPGSVMGNGTGTVFAFGPVAGTAIAAVSGKEIGPGTMCVLSTAKHSAVVQPPLEESC